MVGTQADAHPLARYDLSFAPTTGFFTMAPTLTIIAWGGLMIAEKLSMP
jgi:hypothetical protein